MTLTRCLLGQAAWFRLPTAFGLLCLGLAQWYLQGNLVTDFNEISDADPKTSRQQPQGLERRISHAPLELGEQPRRNDVRGGFDLGEPADPPSPPYIGANGLLESVEIHDSSRTRRVLLLDTNIRKIKLDSIRHLSKSPG